MYDITKTRMLLTTAILAAGAALFAGAANARILGQEDLENRAQVSNGVVDSRFAVTQSRIGSTRYGYVVGGVLIIPAQPSGQLSPAFIGVADTGVADDRFDIGVPFSLWGV